MATQREIRKRISSVASTKKITKTMEMVATSKMKKVLKRLHMVKPYCGKLHELIANVSSGQDVASTTPLMKKRENPQKALILVVTGNRGLCGGFNINAVEEALTLKEKLTVQGKDASLYVFGKKGGSYLSFLKEPVYKVSPNLEDKITFEKSVEIADEITALFLKGKFDEVYLVYTESKGSGSSRPKIVDFLPISPMCEEDEKPINYTYEPDPEHILSYILPLHLRVTIFSAFLESGYNEQFARRVAMKNATDAADDIVKDLTVSYNRVRQAKITKEISEIVGGASAL